VKIIACLHTAASNVAVFDDVVRTGRMPLTLTHTIRTDFLDRIEQCGVDPALREEVQNLTSELRVSADAVLLTCSSLGPAIVPPTLRADQALADQAVQNGGRVMVLCAAPTTVAATRTLFETAARQSGAQIEVLFIPSAWDLFRRGEIDAYHRLIALTADELPGGSTIALAQSSMAGAALLCVKTTPFTVPHAALSAACS